VTDKETVEVRVVLEDEVKDKFLAIKRARSIRANTDVIRYVISIAYDKEMGKHD
jgi:hypothetical protein